MSVKGKRLIFVGGDESLTPLHVEAVAIAAVAPGTCMVQTAAGLDASSIAATVFGEQFLIADKDQMRQKSVDDAWVINENMVAVQPRPGERVNVLVVTGQALITGTALAKNGAGLLVIAASTSLQHIVAYADEVVTTTGTQLVRVKAA